ncbi:MAG TPA: M48 family metallopeptidase [Geobacteraceae bacterium]
MKEAGLEEEIRALMAKVGLQVGAVQQMDASQRSRHSNAYFTGIGRVKRIVLYDTLLAHMDHGEVLAVLAHEVGHWHRGHVWKRLFTAQLASLVGCYLVYRLIVWGGLPAMFGLEGASFAAQLVLLGFLSSFLGFLFTPVGSWFSRHQEWQADEFAATLTAMPRSLASALVKLATENLANLHPHPLYARFYYSHPPVVERVGRLLAAAEAARAGSCSSTAGV